MSAPPPRPPSASPSPASPPPAEPHPESVDYETVGTEARELPPRSTLESFLSEFLGAVPEVRDSLLVAADALLDAARALIDAVDRALHTTGDEQPRDT
jgi:hypothetical protein